MSRILDEIGLDVDGFMLLAPKPRRQVVELLLRWEHEGEALPLIEKLVQADPSGLLDRAHLVLCLAARGRHQEAQAVLDELEIDYPGRPYTLAAAGDLNLASKDYPKALECYLKILDQRKQNTLALRRLARLYLDVGQLDKSYAYCKSAMAVAKHDNQPLPHIHPGILRTLASIHEQKGDKKLATEIRKGLAKRFREEMEHYGGLVTGDAGKKRVISDQSSVISNLSPVSDSPGVPSPGLTFPGHPCPHDKDLEVLGSGTGTRNSRSITDHSPLPFREGGQGGLGYSEIPPHSALKNIQSVLKDLFNIETFRPGQQQAVEAALSGESQLVVMPTGGGKSLCYQLPAAMLDGTTLVISPLIALMKDQVDGLPENLRKRTTYINSSLESAALRDRLQGLAQGSYKLVYAAPERLRQGSFLEALKQAGVLLFVIDEVHCVSVWGHDFRPDYLFIAPALEILGSPPILGMTATVTPQIRRDIEVQLGRKLRFTSAGTCRPNLRLEVRDAKSNDDKLRVIAEVCKQEQGCGIIYANTRNNAEKVFTALAKIGVSAGFYHAGMNAGERERAQDAFMTGTIRVMAATTAFGMGIDKPDVRFVLHFSMPRSLENYCQEAGRAGRDGLPSRCMLLYNSRDRTRLERWVENDALDFETIRLVYENIKAQLAGAVRGIVDDRAIYKQMGFDETTVRVALSILERTGLLRRHIEDSGKGICLEMLRPSGKPKAEIEKMLSDYKAHNLQKIDVMAKYASTPICRHGFIARYFGEMPGSNCSACDNCLGEQIDAPTAADAQLTEKELRDAQAMVLRAIHLLPLPMGRRHLVRAFTGSPLSPIKKHEWEFLGSLSHLSSKTVGKLIDALIIKGYLERSGRPMHPVLVLTKSGEEEVGTED